MTGPDLHKLLFQAVKDFSLAPYAGPTHIPVPTRLDPPFFTEFLNSRMAWLAALVDMPSVTNLHNRYDKKLICHLIYDSVRTLPDPVSFLS